MAWLPLCCTGAAHLNHNLLVADAGFAALLLLWIRTAGRSLPDVPRWQACWRAMQSYAILPRPSKS